MNLQSLFDSTIDIVLARSFAEQDIDGECSSGDGETRCVVVELGELPKFDECISVVRKPVRADPFQVRLTFSAFIVAEVTISLRSRRLDKTAHRGSTSV